MVAGKTGGVTSYVNGVGLDLQLKSCRLVLVGHTNGWTDLRIGKMLDTPRPAALRCFTLCTIVEISKSFRRLRNHDQLS